MNTRCTFLCCILVVLLERIFTCCEGINSSASTASSQQTRPTDSRLSSPSWCLDCTHPSTQVHTSTASTVISSNQTSIQPDNTKSMSSSSAMMTSVVSPTKKMIAATTKPARRVRPAPQLTSFGIFLITFGGVLVAFMIMALVWICCGRERSPAAPHPQVKLKPWSHGPAEHSVNDVATEASDLPNSYQNQGLNSSSPINSPSTPTDTNGRRTTENVRESPLI